MTKFLRGPKIKSESPENVLFYYLFMIPFEI